MKDGIELANKYTLESVEPGVRPFIGDKAASKGMTEDQLAYLATNENPFPPSPNAIEAMEKVIRTANLYPDPSGTLLRRKLASIFGLDELQVVLGNGADELLYCVGKAFINIGDNAVISTPCYPSESRAIWSMGGEVKEIAYRKDFTCDIEATLKAIDDKTKMVILCTPGNPNTRVIPHEEYEWFMERVPEDVIVVMDEAYKEFNTDKNAAEPHSCSNCSGNYGAKPPGYQRRERAFRNGRRQIRLQCKSLSQSIKGCADGC